MSDENPYVGRDHEKSSMDGSDLHAVAALVGNVTGTLKDIDSKNVGSGTEFTRALKMDPHAAIKSMIGTQSPQPTPQSQPTPPPTAPNVPELIPMPEAPAGSKPTKPPESTVSHDYQALERRIEKLERDISNYSKSFKFKRGISYDINTVSIKGNFKNPNDIVEIVLSELAKNAKSITIKLNNANKIRK